ncbi:MAG: phosphoglycerate kinase [Holosporaceae bacterium]|jgi:phosphoglycerate kinase|nr:phosphoglycerate kinase [Holosporaceae bacterium]
MYITKNELKNKKVLLRTDFNVPIEDGIIQDYSRIKNTFDTVKFLKDAEAKIILISHLGKTTSPNPKQSLKQIVSSLEKEYESPIAFIADCLDEKAISEASEDIILLENLRFYQEEEKCDENFAKCLAKSADFYINEAFSVSHRNHASISALPKFLPHAFGLSFAKETQTLNGFLQNSSSKMCIIGGAKLSTKINLLKNIVKKVNRIAIGGGIAGAFLSFMGNQSLKIFHPGNYEEDIKEIIKDSKQCDCELIIPTDFSALISDKETLNHKIISSKKDNATIFDIGPDSVELFKKGIEKSKMILWNGPIGFFEKAPFNFGTESIAKYVAQLTKEKKLVSIVGGGDTCFAMNKFNVFQDLSYVSTAGGAFLCYLEGGELPGITAMKNPYVLTESYT